MGYLIHIQGLVYDRPINHGDKYTIFMKYLKPHATFKYLI